MCKSLMIFVLLFAFLEIQAQEASNTIGTVEYSFQYIADTLNPEKVKTEAFQLTYSKTISKYFSLSNQEASNAMKASKEKSLKDGQDATNFQVLGQLLNSTFDIFYTDIKKDKNYRLANFENKPYLLSANSDKINWQIEDSSRIIGGYSCQKAEGESMGRHYIAWFTTDIPYSFGPRRLFGLPGLILEAYDQTGRIQFLFKNSANNSNQSVSLPSDATFATEKDFQQMKAANEALYNTGFRKETQSTVIGTDGKAKVVRTITSGGTINRPKNAQQTINYPIDLDY